MSGVGLETAIEIVEMNALAPTKTELLLHAASSELEPRAIEPRERLGGVGHPDEHGGRIGHHAKSHVARAQGLFSTLLLSDVAGNLRSADDLAAGIFDRRDTERD